MTFLQRRLYGCVPTIISTCIFKEWVSTHISTHVSKVWDSKTISTQVSKEYISMKSLQRYLYSPIYTSKTCNISTRSICPTHHNVSDVVGVVHPFSSCSAKVLHVNQVNIKALNKNQYSYFIKYHCMKLAAASSSLTIWFP